jgi:hypothetical protein
LEFRQPDFRNSICRGHISDILNVLLEVVDARGSGVLMKNDKIKLAAAGTGSEELR